MKASVALGTFAAAIILAPFTALLDAFIYSTTWGWLIARQYGPGPTYASWYGLSCLISFAIVSSAPRAKSVSDCIIRVLARWVAFVVILGTIWVTGSILHWIP
jgi:hypothetical protein